MSQVMSRTPIFTQLVFEQEPASYPAVLLGDRLDLHMDAVPEQPPIEPDRIIDPIRPRVPVMLAIGERKPVAI